MTISQQTLRKERSFSIFFMTHFVVIPTKTYTSLVSIYLYPRIIKLRRKSHNLSQKSLFWTSIEPFAIRSFIASYNVFPLAIPELFARTQGSDYWQLVHYDSKRLFTFLWQGWYLYLHKEKKNLV